MQESDQSALVNYSSSLILLLLSEKKKVGALKKPLEAIQSGLPPPRAPRHCHTVVSLYYTIFYNDRGRIQQQQEAKPSLRAPLLLLPLLWETSDLCLYWTWFCHEETEKSCRSFYFYVIVSHTNWEERGRSCYLHLIPVCPLDSPFFFAINEIKNGRNKTEPSPLPTPMSDVVSCVCHVITSI